MNRAETLKIMSVIRAAYPGYYRDSSPDEAKTAANLWQAMFTDWEYAIVDKAVKALIATSKWPPTVAEVQEMLLTLTQPPVRTELDAWGFVSKAIGNSAYEAREEFAKLPEDIRRVVGSPSVLHQWALMDIREVQTVVASNFQRSYRARAAENRKMQALPQDVRMMIEATKIQSLPSPEFKTDDERRAEILKQLEDV